VRVADTSFLYALISATDSLHERALRASQDSEPVTIPAEIFSETVALVQYRSGFEDARAAGEWLRSQAQVQIGVGTQETLLEAWHTFVQAGGRLSYPDSVVVAWCRPRGFSPLAFDTRILAHARR
jgi:predicted nucleic acid-binding protein